MYAEFVSYLSPLIWQESGDAIKYCGKELCAFQRNHTTQLEVINEIKPVLFTGSSLRIL